MNLAQEMLIESALVQDLQTLHPHITREQAVSAVRRYREMLLEKGRSDGKAVEAWFGGKNVNR